MKAKNNSTCHNTDVVYIHVHAYKKSKMEISKNYNYINNIHLYAVDGIVSNRVEVLPQYPWHLDFSKKFCATFKK